MCYTIQNNTLDYYAYFYPRKREIMTTQDYRTRRPLRIFLSYFRPHRGLFLLDITCAFFIAVIDLAFPLISRTAMYHWLPEKQFSIFFTVMALVVAAFVLRAGLYFIVGYWGHTFGIPVEADLVMDVRFMPNPYYIEELKHKTGLDDGVRDYVFSFSQTNEFMRRMEEMMSFLLPLYSEEGKTVLVLAIGCTGGHHRSVAVAHALAEYIQNAGYPVTETHRDITR